MITFIRSLFGTKLGGILALVFVGLIAVAFALSDVSGNLGGGVGSGNVAQVGSEEVAISELENNLQNRLRGERQQNPTLDMGRFLQSGGLESTLDQIINRFALTVFGEENGLGVSKRLIDSEINKIPQSKGIDGEYSAEAFQAFLSGIGLNEQAVRRDMTQGMYARQILATTIKGTRAPESMVVPYASLLLEKRTGKLASVPSILFLPKAPPSEAILAKHYKDNVVKFTIPEKRAISYALFDKSIVAAKAKPSASDIAAYYKQNAAKYAASESRFISQIIVPTEAAAKALAAKITGGQAPDIAANAGGLSVNDIPEISKSELTTAASKAVADAAFAAKSGGVATPARGSLGWYVVKVNNVISKPARTLAQVSSEIAGELEKTRAAEMLAELTTEIEDEFASGGTIGDLAKAQGLKVETTAKLLANGVDANRPDYKPIPEMQIILPAAFAIEEGGDAQLIEIIPGEKFALVAVAEIEEAAPPPLAKIKQAVAQSWAIDEASKKAKATADKLAKAVSGGKSLEAAIAELGFRLPAMQSVSGTRDELNKEGQLLSPPLALLFSMKKGSAKTLAAPGQNGWFVVQAVEVIRGDASGQKEKLAAQRLELGQLLEREYTQQMVQAIISDVGVERNDKAIDGLKARLTQTGTGQ